MAAASTTETHISTLFFTEDRVFKLLKPVATGFLDHRSREARLDAAQAEYELNRRMAPDVYLGVADVVENGVTVDRMVVMRRLPSERAMTAVIQRGELTDDHLRSVARAIAVFHERLDPIFDEDGPGTLTVQRANWESSFADLEPFVGDVLDPVTNMRIESLVRSYLDSHAEIFAGRVAQGYVRDTHGDLLADDIFLLDDGPRILDCIAFADELRIGDVLSDIAFLAMDLHRLAGPASASTLIRDYCEFSGEAHPASLAHHYVAYRAHVRCKVSCLRMAQGHPEYGAVARMYHRLTLDQLERARTRLVLVGGGPGTGKTSVSTRLADALSWAVVHSDEVRKDLAGVDRLSHAVATPDEGIYAPEMTERTYREIVRQAELLLAAGQTAVLDASWTRNEHREWARRLADEHRAELVEFECVVDVALARERVTRRLADQWNTSDATPEVVDHLRSIRDPWPEAYQLPTARSLEETVATAVDRLLDGGADVDAAPPPAIDFWGTYVAYNELAGQKPFHTVVVVDRPGRTGPARRGDQGP